MIFSSLLAVVTIVALATSAWSETLTAVCKDPKGRALGIEGKRGEGKPLDEPSNIRGQFTLIWQVGTDEAQVVSTGGGGPQPLLERARRIHSSDDSATFVVIYPRGVWLYSIFWKPGRLLLTRHSESYGLDFGGAAVLSMQAACDVTFN